MSTRVLNLFVLICSFHISSLQAQDLISFQYTIDIPSCDISVSNRFAWIGERTLFRLDSARHSMRVELTSYGAQFVKYLDIDHIKLDSVYQDAKGNLWKAYSARAGDQKRYFKIQYLMKAMFDADGFLYLKTGNNCTIYKFRYNLHGKTERSLPVVRRNAESASMRFCNFG